MADQQTLAQAHSTEVWTALIGMVTLCISLITVIWSLIHGTIKDYGIRLDGGQKEFEKIRERLTKVEQQIEHLKDEDKYQGEELDRLESDIKLINKDLSIIISEHNNCIPRKLSLLGNNK